MPVEAGRGQIVVVTSCEGRDHIPAIADVYALTAARAVTNVILMSAQVHADRQSVAQWALAEPGLSAVLRRERSLSEAVTGGPVPTLRLLPAGRTVDDPQVTLTSQSVVAVVNDLQSRSAVLVIEAPPLLTSARPHGPDTLGLLHATGAGVLLVVVEGHTLRRSVRRAVRLLGEVQAPLVGLVLVRGQARGRRVESLISGSAAAPEPLRYPPPGLPISR
jgi:Mrp family chromosome partitioning ATPase